MDRTCFVPLYPKHLKTDFRKLERHTLVKILRHYGLNPRQDVNDEELALIAARCFDKTKLPGNDFIDKFAVKHCYSFADKSQFGTNKKLKTSHEKSKNEAAKPGEQVAAKLNKTLDDGKWVLANVLSYDHRTLLYAVQDEDDTASAVATPLPMCEVKRLDDSAAHLKKGDLVLAVFPETTSFYKAVVAKVMKPLGNGNASTSSSNWEVVVRFDDDVEDGKILPSRRIPARFVVKRSDLENSNSSHSSAHYSDI